MNKIYKEIAFNFTKALNKLELRTSARSFISMRKTEKVISLLFEIIFDKLERDGKVNIRGFCIIKKIKCRDGKYYFEFIDNRKK
jgi:nucleoid DNA-binding protein